MPHMTGTSPPIPPRPADTSPEGCGCGCSPACPLTTVERGPLARTLSRVGAVVTIEIPAGAIVNLARHLQKRLLTLRRGLLKVGCGDPEGRLAIGGLRYPGDPLEPYGTCAGREMFLEAVVPSTICALDPGPNDAAGDTIARILAHRLERLKRLVVAAERRCVSLLSKPPDARVAWFLLELAEHPEHRPGGMGGNGAEVIDLILRRRDIAENLGLAAETVSRALTRLKRARIVKRLSRGRLQIVRRASLAELAANSVRLS